MLRALLVPVLFAALFGGRAAAQENWTQVVPLEGYKPDYFLMGQPETKIQLSLKIQLIQGQNLYFGYTQLMLWELFRQSPYFSDLNYNPEVFYRFPIGDSGDRWVDFGPFEHESNGKGGADERSWNRTYVRGHDEWDLGGRAKLRAELKAWVPYSFNPSNRNLPNYRGLWETNVMLSDFRGNYTVEDLIFRLYAGGPSNVDPTRGGQELTFRVKSAKRKIMPVLMFQVFHGYAETLADYRHSYWAYRAGIGF
jgi:outer membrane phospholipase A